MLSVGGLRRDEMKGHDQIAGRVKWASALSLRRRRPIARFRPASGFRS